MSYSSTRNYFQGTEPKPPSAEAGAGDRGAGVHGPSILSYRSMVWTLKRHGPRAMRRGRRGRGRRGRGRRGRGRRASSAGAEVAGHRAPVAGAEVAGLEVAGHRAPEPRSPGRGRRARGRRAEVAEPRTMRHGPRCGFQASRRLALGARVNCDDQGDDQGGDQGKENAAGITRRRLCRKYYLLGRIGIATE